MTVSKPAFFIIICFILSSCVERIRIESYEDDAPIVVKCILTKEFSTREEATPQFLDLYYARKSSLSPYQPISEATVVVREHDPLFNRKTTYQFLWNGERWECSFFPKSGALYALEINIPGRGRINASTRMPKALGLLSVFIDNQCPAHYSQFACPEEGFNAAKDESFAWLTFKYNGNPLEIISTNHPGADGFNVCTEFWDNLNLKKVCDKLYPEDSGESAGRWSKFDMIGRNSPLYKDFIRIHHLPDEFDSGLDGVIGDYTQRDLFINGTEPANGFFTLFPEIESKMAPEIPVRGLRITIRSLSKEYDAYLRDVVNNALIHGDEFNQTYGPDKVYTNINGGIGCFGAEHIYN